MSIKNMAMPVHVARGLAVKWAQEMLKLDSFYIVDTETTGVKVKYDAIVQVACLHYPTLTMTAWEIDPEQVIGRGAMKVHGKTNESREGLPNFGDIYNHLANRFNGDKIVIYNAPFDYPLLQNQAIRYGKPEFNPTHVIDAMDYAALSYGQWNDKGFWRPPKLSKWAQMMQIGDTSDAHDARSDCLFVYESILKLSQAQW